MFGQSYIKFEIFPKLNEPEVQNMIKQFQNISPIEDQPKDYYIYAYEMLQTVNLQYLMECLPFIKLTFCQLLLLIRDIILAIQKHFNIGFIPYQLQKNNIYFSHKGKDSQFTYYYQKLNYEIDFIGVKWNQVNMKNQGIFENYYSNIKNLALELFILFKQKYGKKIDKKVKEILDQFENGFFTNQNVLSYIEQFLEKHKYNQQQQYFLEESKSLREKFSKFADQMKKGSEIIEVSVMEQQTEIIDKGLENYFNQTILSSFKSHLYNTLYTLLEKEIDAFIIQDQISCFQKKLEPKLKIFIEAINFDSSIISLIFQDQFDQYRSLKEYFSGHFKIESNWVSQIQSDLLNPFFIIVGQSGKLNSFTDLLQVLNYIKYYISNRGKQQNTLIQTQNFEQQLIRLLEQYLKGKFDNLF